MADHCGVRNDFFESDWRINMEPTKIAMQIKKWYQPHHTLIVGMDGLGGAGKSTLSESLYQLLSEDLQHRCSSYRRFYPSESNSV